MSYFPYQITMALTLMFINHNAFAINDDYIKEALNICNADFTDSQINKKVRLTTYSKIEEGAIKNYTFREMDSYGRYFPSYSNIYINSLRNIVAIRYVTTQYGEDYESYFVGAVCKKGSCININNKGKLNFMQFTKIAECNTLEKARKTAEILASALDVNLVRENDF